VFAVRLPHKGERYPTFIHLKGLNRADS